MELVAIILVIAAVAAAEVLIFGKYALKGIYYSASVNKAEVYEGETLELTEVVENRRFVALPWIKTELSASPAIGEIGHAGATYQAMEFAGDAIEALPMDERICISNMTVEAGAKVGLIPADEKTVAYMEEHGVRDAAQAPRLRADPDAKYVRTLEFDAASLEPTVACPHEVDNTCAVGTVAGTHVDQVYIGSCTGGRFSDLMAAAEILKGKHVADGCRLLISPASRLIWNQASRMGLLDILSEAGATVLASTCGACLGLHSGTIGSGEVCVSTTNRNFIGRMGSKYGDVYLASAATAAATALEGRLADPRAYL